MAKQVRIEWKNHNTGKTGHGEWHPLQDESMLVAWCQAMNKENPHMSHCIEEGEVYETRIVCTDIECPWYDATHHFCVRYDGHAGHCHVAWQEPGTPYSGIRPMDSSTLLYADEGYDVAAAKARNEAFMATHEEQQRIRLDQSLQ